MLRLILSLFSVLVCFFLTCNSFAQTATDEDLQKPLLEEVQKLHQTLPQIKQQVQETLQAEKKQIPLQGNSPVEKLEQQNAVLQARVNELNQELHQVRNQAFEEKLQQKNAMQAATFQHQNNLRQDHGAIKTQVIQPPAFIPKLGAQFILGIILLILLILAWVFVRSPKKNKLVSTTHREAVIDFNPKSVEITQKPVEKIDPDLEEEYDFMSSDEAIPIKLDLARAYIAMEEYTQAKEVLTMILTRGSKQQKQEAEYLLQQLKV